MDILIIIFLMVFTIFLLEYMPWIVLFQFPPPPFPSPKMVFNCCFLFIVFILFMFILACIIFFEFFRVVWNIFRFTIVYNERSHFSYNLGFYVVTLFFIGFSIWLIFLSIILWHYFIFQSILLSFFVLIDFIHCINIFILLTHTPLSVTWILGSSILTATLSWSNHVPVHWPFPVLSGKTKCAIFGLY